MNKIKANWRNFKKEIPEIGEQIVVIYSGNHMRKWIDSIRCIQQFKDAQQIQLTNEGILHNLESAYWFYFDELELPDGLKRITFEESLV